MERVLLGKAKVCVGPNREPLRMFEAEREHRIAETLQRSLLPDRLPELPGVLLAARYVPASADMEVGGDWYDVVQLPNGQVGLAIGTWPGTGDSRASVGDDHLLLPLRRTRRLDRTLTGGACAPPEVGLRVPRRRTRSQ